MVARIQRIDCAGHIVGGGVDILVLIQFTVVHADMTHVLGSVVVGEAGHLGVVGDDLQSAQ